MMSLYLTEMKEFSKFRKRDILDTSKTFEGSYHFDLQSLLSRDYEGAPLDYSLQKPVRVSFSHNEAQKSAMESYIKQYGTSVVGMGRILMRAHVKRPFRNINVNGEMISKGFEKTYRRALNLYGD